MSSEGPTVIDLYPICLSDRTVMHAPMSEAVPLYQVAVGQVLAEAIVDHPVLATGIIALAMWAYNTAKEEERRRERLEQRQFWRNVEKVLQLAEKWQAPRKAARLRWGKH